jgi:hypothetical protein
VHDNALLPFHVVPLCGGRKPVGGGNRELEAFPAGQAYGQREDPRGIPSPREADETRRPQERRHDRTLQRFERRSGFSRRGQPLGRRQSEDEARSDLEATEDQSRCVSVRCACASRSARASRVVPSASSSHSEALVPFVLSDAGGGATRERWGSAFPAALASDPGEPPRLIIVRRTSVSVRRTQTREQARIARPAPRSGTNRKEGAPGTREGHQRRRGRESAESGAQPAPRREPRPARVVLPTVPLGSRQAHATKVESANRVLPPGSAPSTGSMPANPTRTMICTGFPQACGAGEGAEAAENLCFRQKLYEALGENPSKPTQNALSIRQHLSRQLLERRPFR